MYIQSITSLSDKKFRCTLQEVPYGLEKTLGHILRRVFMSSVSGIAITQVQIDEASHEYETLPYFLENNTTILNHISYLNLKFSYELQRLISNGNVEYHFVFQGPGEIRGRDFSKKDLIDVVNEDIYIGTVTEPREINITYIVAEGRRYTALTYRDFIEHKPYYLPVLANFNPVIRSCFHTEKNKIHYEVETNGTIEPDILLQECCKSLVSAIKSLSSYPPLYFKNLSELGLEKAITSILSRHNIHSFFDLIRAFDTLHSMEQIGSNRMQTIQMFLEEKLGEN